jgi:hypothetical protein
MATAYLGLGPGQVPHASSVTRIAQQVGGAFGTAILAMVLSIQAKARQSAGLQGQATAFGTALWRALGFTVIAVIPALLLPVRTKTQPPPAHSACPAAMTTRRKRSPSQY